MPRQRIRRGQGTIYQRDKVWWCAYSVDGVRRRESCQTSLRDEALAYLHRKQGRLASGELLTPDRVTVRDLLNLLLEDYDTRNVAQAYIATLKIKSILLPRLGDVKAARLASARIKEYVESRLKGVKPATVNWELGMLHRAFQLGYNQDPPLVARVPYFPRLTEDEPRKGFLKPQTRHKLLAERPSELQLLFVIAYHVGLRTGGVAAHPIVTSGSRYQYDLDGGTPPKSKAGTHSRPNLRRYCECYFGSASD